ncbi:MAG: carboxypeptidase-like regulatory domain-containing protein, partial [Planctomycetota bacterium]
MIQDVTNQDGAFEIRPVSKKYQIRFPIFLRAFRENDPNRVAWTMLADPESSGYLNELLRTVPGEPGKVDVVTNRLGRRACGGASGIVLQIEPAETIAGRITDGHNEPVSDVTVYMHALARGPEGEPIPDGTLFLDKTETDTNGQYVLANLPRLLNGFHYRLLFLKDGYGPLTRLFQTEGP